MPETTYIVLKAREAIPGDEGGWDRIGPDSVEAASANAALRKALASRSDASGTFVAVPARSWKPVTVSAVQTTVLKLDPT